VSHSNPLQPKRVLFVDDEDAIRSLAAITLEAAGYDVELASDGAEAIAKLSEQFFDLVATDIVMPNKEGVETIIEIRQRWPEVAILALSGGGRIGPEMFLTLAKHVGAQALLRKPYRPSELLAAIHGLLEGDATQAA